MFFSFSKFSSSANCLATIECLCAHFLLKQLKTNGSFLRFFETSSPIDVEERNHLLYFINVCVYTVFLVIYVKLMLTALKSSNIHNMADISLGNRTGQVNPQLWAHSVLLERLQSDDPRRVMEGFNLLQEFPSNRAIPEYLSFDKRDEKLAAFCLHANACTGVITPEIGQEFKTQTWAAIGKISPFPEMLELVLSRSYVLHYWYEGIDAGLTYCGKCVLNVISGRIDLFTDQKALAHVAVFSENSQDRTSAVSMMSDTDALIAVAVDSEYAETACLAMDKVAGNPDNLVCIAKNVDGYEHRDVVRSAVQKLKEFPDALIGIVISCISTMVSNSHYSPQYGRASMLMNDAKDSLLQTGNLDRLEHALDAHSWIPSWAK
jgi:hypothetical protein